MIQTSLCDCRPNERDSHPFLEDGMGVQDSSHSHVDSMCGDGQSKPLTRCANNSTFTFFSHQITRRSVPSTGLRHYMKR